MPRQDTLELALRHLQAGRSAEAERLFKAILRKHPAHPDALHYLGVAAFGKGNHKIARRLLRKASEARPEDGEIHYNLGVVLGGMGKTEEAVAAYRRTLEIMPDHAKAPNNLGNALTELGDIDEALLAYRRAIDNEPDHPLAFYNLGDTLLVLGRPLDALPAYRRALEINPDIAEIHDGLGTCLMALGQTGEAVAVFRHAIGIRPDFAEAHGRLGEALLKSRQIEEAEAALRRAIDLKADLAEAHNVLGQLLSLKGQQEVALSYLDKAMELASDEIRYRHSRGVIMSKIVRHWHFSMMNDATRNAAFERVIAKMVKPGMHVLDIGTGSGLLAMMAARAGAGRVTTCESVGLIAEKAREIIALNGYGDRIQVLARNSVDLVVGRDIKDRADLLVCEILSNSVVGEGVIPSLEHARRELLKPGAPIIPRTASIVACLVGPRDLAEWVCVDTVAGFNLGPFNAFSPHKYSLPPEPLDFEILSDDRELFEFDFTSGIKSFHSRELEFEAIDNGTCLGLIQWIRFSLDGETVFENHPRRQDQHYVSHWNIVLFPFAEPVEIGTGDKVHVAAKYTIDSLYVDFKGVTG